MDDPCGAVARFDGTSVVVLNTVAAFYPSSSPRLAGVTFGIDYDDSQIFLSGFGHCGDFELSTGAWPAPGEGTAITWGAAQESNLTEVYWFAAYNYYGNPNLLALSFHPTQGANFADDSVPSELDPIVALGAFGFSTAGDAPCFEGGVGACCLAPDDCVDGVTQSGCEDAGGEYGGDGTVCDDPGFCEGQSGACCLPDGSCEEIDPETCDTLGGEYFGDGTNCGEVSCSTPTIDTSWGTIKSGYRH